MSQARILIADDDPGVLAALRLLLENRDYRVTERSSPDGVLEAVGSQDVDLLIMDLNYSLDTTSGAEGVDLIPKLLRTDETLPIVVMTGWGTIDLAVRTMKLGAADFVQKPWENERLLATVRSLLRLRRSERSNRRLSAENDLLRARLGASKGTMIAESPAMRRVLDLVDRVADSAVSLLITGENGTGKSLLANLIHRRSARRDRPFIEVNMGSVSEHLFESELFGHVRGAFTDAREGRLGRFELADTGTLFLDEIGNTPMTQQPKLLRVLEQGAFEKVGSSRTQSADVRLISASNADLDAAVEAGRFRTDLLYRINTLQLELPPLRDRQEDIKPLAEHFFTLAVRRYASGSSGVSGSAMSRLRRYRWPGNVRELQHVIERAVLLSGDGLIESTHLGLPPDDTDGEGHGEAADRTLADIEKAAIVDRLERFDGNGLEAARSLGLSRSAFYRRREKYGV